MGERVVVVGLAVTGTAVARRLMAEGKAVVAVDDRPDDAVRRRAADLGVELVEAPSPAELAELAGEADLVVVSPGVPARHPVFALAGRAPLVSEVELAGRMARAPIVAVTGTNGKTTVTTLVAEMLEASGRRALAAGNIGLPLVDAVRRDVDVLVAEVSSFQLQLTSTFRPRVAVWLNLAEDHLDWHPTMRHYVEAKARVWANQSGADLAVANADDALVWRAAAGAPAALAGFSLRSSALPRLPGRGQ
ncbi:MAG TPA: UDP-N-acetylmuramoyl-L-alanine--D-glutamate ligase, partial [Acidimicrobiales bacterium]|nr:UDP-N-acetylmuramoyl-L-alanine--D-glutamate ligase [Acidimicrobiales bacterium]